jgi:beta-glucanase (GH16 family)
MRANKSPVNNPLVLGACAVLAVAGLAYGPKVLHPQGPIRWTTVWYDNFSGTSASQPLNPKYWEFDIGTAKFGNGEVQTMTNSTANVHLDPFGGLGITALLSNGSWTSGRIQTTHLYGAAPGGEMEVTASIEQPDPEGGLGYWPAFWLLGPGSWPESGEIDVMEDVDGISDVSAALHCGSLTSINPDGTYGPCHEHAGLGSGLQPCASCQTGYHTYSVIVDRRDTSAEQITWYLDGHEFFTVHESRVGAEVWSEAVDHGFSIILDLAMGGTYPDERCRCTTPGASTTSGGTLKVRYVAVYER